MVTNILKSATTATTSKANRLRSSIDNRKQRISSSKLDHKRNSIKKVNAFLKDLTKSNTKQQPQQQHPIMATPSYVKKATNIRQQQQERPNDPSLALTSTQISTTTSLVKTIKEELFSYSIKTEPTEVSTTTTMASSLTTVTRSVSKNRELIASNLMCQQNYRVTQSANKNTPMTRKNSFNKFLERNTPNKLTKYVRQCLVM